MKKLLSFAILSLLFFAECKQEDKTVSFPTNIFMNITDEKNQPLDSATICLFSDFTQYNNALAAYDISKAYRSTVSKKGKAEFSDIESDKQYWIFCFKKIEKTAFKNADKIADNFAISDIFTITPKKSSDSNIEIKLVPNSGVVVFSFLGQNLGIGLDSIYKIKLNDKQIGPFVPNSVGYTNFYPTTVRKNIPFSYLIESNNGLCAWTERDITITNDVTFITLQPCVLARVGFVHDFNVGGNNRDKPVFSSITISGFDKGNLIKVDTNYSTCSQQITKTILLSPGNYTFAANYTLSGFVGAFVNSFTVSGTATCVNTTSGVRFQEILIK